MAQKQRLQRVSVGLSEDELAALQAMAEQHDISMAWLGRQAVREFLDRYREEALQLPLALSTRKAATS